MANGIMGLPPGVLSQDQGTQLMGAANDQARQRAISGGLLRAGAGILGGGNLQEGLSQGLLGFSEGYNRELIANRPKVTPLANGAFSQISFPDGRVEVMNNQDVQKFLREQEAMGFLQKKQLAEIAAGTKTQNLAESTALGQSGEIAQARSGVKGLRDVANSLTTGVDNSGNPIFKTDISGPWLSLLPEEVRKRVYPDSAVAQKRAESIIQGSLKATLGSQFTKAEGDRFLARAYDPALNEAENYRRLMEVAAEIEAIANAKEEAVNYMRKNGTLEGFVPQGSKFTETNQTVPTFNSPADVEAAIANGTLKSGQPFKNPNGTVFRAP